MGRVFICGDTHGGEIGDGKKLTSRNFTIGNDLDKNDYMIVLGDFGYVWNKDEPSKEELYNYRWFQEKNFTTLFVDGNHENFDRLDALPEIDMFGGKVGVVADSIYHLKRGEIYNINGLKILTFGGGTSIDKNRRTEFISWWRQEAPNEREYANCLNNLEANNYQVDVILTHDCSERIYSLFDFPKYGETSQLQRFFETLEESVDFNKWYFGHYHEDIVFDDKHEVLYESVKEISKKD